MMPTYVKEVGQGHRGRAALQRRVRPELNTGALAPWPKKFQRECYRVRQARFIAGPARDWAAAVVVVAYSHLGWYQNLAARAARLAAVGFVSLRVRGAGRASSPIRPGPWWDRKKIATGCNGSFC